ncbi:unnamed protein product, partial [Didymodactylos carnosus]
MTAENKDMIYPDFTELRIYPSFSEIREKFNAPSNFKIYFPLEVYAQIVSGSLSIEGVPVLSQNSVTKANNLEGQTVFVRRSGVQPIECQVIRPNDLLLKDIKTNRYLKAEHHDLEYVTIPEEEGTEVSFALKTGAEVTLSYLINGITWSPRYNLKVSGEQHTFEAWADMTNSTKRDYKIKRTEIFGGDVRLNSGRGLGFGRARRHKKCLGYDGCSTNECAPQIQSKGELAGIYWYSIDQPFVLLSQSTFSLPFVEPNITLTKYVGLELSFSERAQRGKFQRKYRIESDQFLPRGTVTVREDGRVVGQAHAPDMPIGDKQDLDCGNDPDVSYLREVKVLSQKRNSAIYDIKLIL